SWRSRRPAHPRSRGRRKPARAPRRGNARSATPGPRAAREDGRADDCVTSGRAPSREGRRPQREALHPAARLASRPGVAILPGRGEGWVVVECTSRGMSHPGGSTRRFSGAAARRGDAPTRRSDGGPPALGARPTTDPRPAVLLVQTLGAEVVLTRGADATLPLAARTARANAEGADLFVSIHANASPRPRLHGVETYYLNNTHDRGTIRLAAMENGLSL